DRPSRDAFDRAADPLQKVALYPVAMKDTRGLDGERIARSGRRPQTGDPRGELLARQCNLQLGQGAIPQCTHHPHSSVASSLLRSPPPLPPPPPARSTPSSLPTLSTTWG